MVSLVRFFCYIPYPLLPEGWSTSWGWRVLGLCDFFYHRDSRLCSELIHLLNGKMSRPRKTFLLMILVMRYTGAGKQSAI